MTIDFPMEHIVEDAEVIVHNAITCTCYAVQIKPLLSFTDLLPCLSYIKTSSYVYRSTQHCWIGFRGV